VDGRTKYDHRADVYSLGVVLAELLLLENKSHRTLSLPDATQLTQERLQLMKQLQQTRHRNKYGEELVEAILSMLHTNPADRPGIEQVKACLDKPA
jgi:serine/threonine protein kinase